MNRLNPGPPKQPTGDPTRFLDQDDPLADLPEEADVGVVPPIEGELTPEEVTREFKAFNDQIRILLYENNHLQSSAFPLGPHEPAFRQPGTRGLEDARKMSGSLVPPPDQDVADFRALNYSLPEGEIYIRVNSSRHGTSNYAWVVYWYPKDKENYSVGLWAHQDPMRLEVIEVEGEHGKQIKTTLPVMDQATIFHGLLDECLQTGDTPGDKFRYQ